MSDHYAAALVEELPDVEAPELMASRAARIAYAILGFISLGLGLFGVAVPGFPGTVFLLVATAFFFKSSERMYNWVMNHPRFGPTVRAYRAGYGIRRRIKVYAISMMLISVTLSVVFAIDGVAFKVFLVVLAGIGTVFILTRPTTEDVLPAA